MKPLFWFKVVFGITVAVLSTLALLCLFAFIGLGSDDPARNLTLYANIALFLGVFLGGGISARGTDSPLINALICGGGCAVLVLLPSIVFSQWGADSLLRLVLTVAASLLGAVVLRSREGSTKRRQSIKRRRAVAKKYGG